MTTLWIVLGTLGYFLFWFLAGLLCLKNSGGPYKDIDYLDAAGFGFFWFATLPVFFMEWLLKKIVK